MTLFHRQMATLWRSLVAGAQRGATGVEYALLLSLVAVVSLAALEQLSDTSESEMDNQIDCVSLRPPPPECQLPAVTTTSSTTPTPTTATTAPPPPELVPTYQVVEQDESEPGEPWWFTFRVLVHTPSTDDNPIEEPVPGVTVRARVRMVDPSTTPPPLIFLPQEFFPNCTTDENGECELTFESPGEDLMQVRFEWIESNPHTDLPDPTIISMTRPE